MKERVLLEEKKEGRKREKAQSYIREEKGKADVMKTWHCNVSITTLLSKVHSVWYMLQWNGEAAGALANQHTYINGV